jgi:DNA replication protein DnaC
VAKRDFRLAKYSKKLATFDRLIIDDLGNVRQSREEIEVLFTLWSEHYEHGCLMLTSNLPFSKWKRIFNAPYRSDILTRLCSDKLGLRSKGQFI